LDLNSIKTGVKLKQLFRDPVELLTSEDGFGLKTATSVQKAIMYTMAKRQIPDDIWSDAAVQRCFGDVKPCAGSLEEILVMSGVRGGKTFLAAAGALWMSQTVKLDASGGIELKPGEIPRVSIVSARVDQAAAAFRYLKGALSNVGSPLNGLLVGEPLAESLIVRHPTGALIEICIVATASAGTSLVARWCAGVIFDEAPRMASEDEGAKKSLDEMVDGVRSRMLDNALIMYIGSPVGPVGLVYKMFTSYFKRPPTHVCVVKARGPDMNPFWWTPERCKKMEKFPDTYRTDVDANFTDLETQMYASVSIDAAMTRTMMVVPPEDGKTYTATMDPATRGNAWTLLIGNTEDNKHFQINLAHQWIGSQSEPLSPKQTMKEARDEFLIPYRITTVTTDQFGADFLRDIMLDLGLGLRVIPFSGKNKYNMYNSVSLRLNAACIELPPMPEMRNDLLSVKKRVTTDEPKVVLPETTDGRHCDFAPPLALMCGNYIEENKEEEKDERPVEVKMAHAVEQQLPWWEPEQENFGGDDFDDTFY
jgi:hypothetical protein